MQIACVLRWKAMPFPTEMHEIRGTTENRSERAEHQQKFENNVTNQRMRQEETENFCANSIDNTPLNQTSLQGWGGD
jgi:hypothetical protein